MATIFTASRVAGTSSAAARTAIPVLLQGDAGRSCSAVRRTSTRLTFIRRVDRSLPRRTPLRRWPQVPATTPPQVGPDTAALQGRPRAGPTWVRRPQVAFMSWQPRRQLLNPPDGVPQQPLVARPSTNDCCATATGPAPLVDGYRDAGVVSERARLGEFIRRSHGRRARTRPRRHIVAAYLEQKSWRTSRSRVERFLPQTMRALVPACCMRRPWSPRPGSRSAGWARPLRCSPTRGIGIDYGIFLSLSRILPGPLSARRRCRALRRRTRTGSGTFSTTGCPAAGRAALRCRSADELRLPGLRDLPFRDGVPAYSWPPTDSAASNTPPRSVLARLARRMVT